MAGGKNLRTYLITAILFLATGVFWMSIVMLQQGSLLLIWPSLASFIAGGLMLFKRSVGVTRSVALATGLYNLVLFSYHAYSALALLESGFASFAYVAAVGYVFGTLIFLVLVFGLYAGSEVLGLSSSLFSEDSRTSM